MRCNLQIEGAGVTPLDVVVDAATDPSAGLRGPAGAAKDVVLRADRADGLVIKNLTTAHAREHGVHVHETEDTRSTNSPPSTTGSTARSSSPPTTGSRAM